MLSTFKVLKNILSLHELDQVVKNRINRIPRSWEFHANI